MKNLSILFMILPFFKSSIKDLGYDTSYYRDMETGLKPLRYAVNT